MQHFAVEKQCFKCFCYAEYLRYYTFENKSDKSYEYQPDGLDENLIETMSSPEIFLGVLVHISTVYLSRTEGSSTIVLSAVIMFSNFDYLDWLKIYFPAQSKAFWQTLFWKIWAHSD